MFNKLASITLAIAIATTASAISITSTSNIQAEGMSTVVPTNDAFIAYQFICVSLCVIPGGAIPECMSQCNATPEFRGNWSNNKYWGP